MRCVPKISYYECAQWKGNNVEELYTFFKDSKSSIKPIFGSSELIFQYYGNCICFYNQVINLGDYIIKKVRKDRSYFEIVSKEDFNTIYKIVNEQED